MTSAAEHSPAVSAALEVRVFERIDGAKRLADEGRFADAHAALGAAQLAFAHALADDFLARLPDPDEPPPGFSTGWPRFRGSIAEALRGVRRQRRGPSAADAYRKVWREYAIELAGRLKTAAARERRGSSESRREQLAAVVEACEEASDLSETFDPAALDAYRRAVDGSFGRARRSPGRVRAALEDAGLPYPLTVVATGLKDAGPIERLSPGPLVSAGAVTAQIRRRRFGVALAAGVVSIPAGLALLWAPTDTWGTFTDSVAILGWGFGVHAVAAVADAQRLGWIAARAARSARRATPGDVALQPGSLIPQREPSN
jgi:hypothetical protein